MNQDYTGDMILQRFSAIIVMEKKMGQTALVSRFITNLGYRYFIFCKGLRPISGVVVLLLALPILIGCSGYLKPATPSPALPSPLVEPTRLLALVSGKITIDDGCITLIEDHFGATYLVAFVPEYSIEIEVDQLRISESQKVDKIIKLGQNVELGGGILGADKSRINSEALKNVPEHCQGNIWLGYLPETENNNK